MRELIAQAEALEWAHSVILFSLGEDDPAVKKIGAQADSLRAQAEQPAEPVIVGTGNTRIVVDPAEPVAHGFAPNDDGKITDALVVGRNDDPEYNIQLYRIPDPRIAALEELLGDSLKGIKVLRAVLNATGLAGVDVAEQLIERIEAALKK